jgi:tripartite-type tricarboxylate transporter receptor subunit TctC
LSFAALVAVAASLHVACAIAGTQAPAYPVKPVRLLVGVPPGSGADTISRAVALQLSQRWGKSVIVDNRPGAGGAIAMDVVTRSTPDGYTLLSASVGLTSTARLLGKVAFDPARGFGPIVEMTSQPYVVIVSPSASYRTIQELIAYARKNPGAINYASSGNGSGSHLGTELFKSMARVDLTRVSYKGVAQALNELAAGQVHVLFTTFVSSMAFIKSSRVVPIAVTTRQRLDSFPALPTVAESGVPGFELSSAYGLFGPAGIPAEISARINADTRAVLQLPDVRARLAADGAEVAQANTPATFKASFAKEVVRWETLARSSSVGDELAGTR